MFGGSLNMPVSITSPDLISLLCFPVQLHSISPAVGNTDSYINLLNTHWCRERRSGQRKRGSRRDKEIHVEREQMKEGHLYSMFVSKKSDNMTAFWVNQYYVLQNVNVEIHEPKVSLKSSRLRGDLVHCMCLSTSDSGQVVLSGRQGWAGQRNNICYCSVALIRLINILHVSPAASDCVPSGLG